MTNKTNIRSSDVWQLKLLTCLMQNKLFPMSSSQEQSNSLVSVEIVRSLLTKTKMIMNEKMNEQKHVVKQLLFAKDLNFLQDFCMQSVSDLMLLATYYDLPLNIFNDSLNVAKLSMIQFIVEFKKRDFQHKETEFISSLWKMLSK